MTPDGLNARVEERYSYFLEESDNDKLIEMTGDVILVYSLRYRGREDLNDFAQVHYATAKIHRNIGISRSEILSLLASNQTFTEKQYKDADPTEVIKADVDPRNLGKMLAYANFVSAGDKRSVGWEVNDYNCTVNFENESMDSNGFHKRVFADLKRCVEVEGEVVKTHYREVDVMKNSKSQLNEISYFYTRETDKYDVMFNARFVEIEF